MSAGAVRAPLIIPLRIPTAQLQKSQIDTNTKLEIISETPNAIIYFTTNGSKPIVKRSANDLHNSGTYKFRKPFTLPSGIQVVRALAFLPETGCESNVVTKKFEVSKANNGVENAKTKCDDDFTFLDDLKAIECHRVKAHKAILDQSEQDFSVRQSTEKRSDKLTRLEVDPLSSGECRHSKGYESLDAAGDSKRSVQKADKATSYVDSSTDVPSFGHVLFDTSSQFSRLQQRTDLLHCPSCFKPRAPNQSQNHCVYCGRDLPVLPMSMATPLAATRLGPCPICHSNVPLNLPVCLVCENSLRSSNNLMRKPQEYRVCKICGTVNSVDTVSCWTCEGRLSTGMENLLLHSSTEPHYTGPLSSSAAITPKDFVHTNGHHSLLLCSHCRRENDPDARYCDWCGLETCNSQGLEPSSLSVHTRSNTVNPPVEHWNRSPPRNQYKAQSYVDFNLLCSACGGANPRQAQFCAFCGIHIPPPDRQPVWSTSSGRISDATNTLHLSRGFVPQKRSPVSSNVATQTVGLFYPSAAELRRKESCLRTNPSIDSQSRDRTPLLTALSPGRGFWRKQLDHIIGHLKVYTCNNPEFQAVIGEPRLGKLVAAGMHASHGQATIMLTYSLPHPNDDQTTTTPSSLTRQSPMTVRSKVGSCRSKSKKMTSSNCYSTTGRWNGQSSGSSTMGTPRNKLDCCTYSSENTKSRPQSEYAVNATSKIGVENGAGNGELPKHRQCNLVDDSVHSRPPNGSARNRVPRRPRDSNTSDHHELDDGVTLDCPRLTVADRNLLRLLSQPGRVSSSEIRQVIDEGANPNCIDVDGNTPLIVAVRHQNVEAIPILVDAGADVNTVGSFNGNTALHEAVSFGSNGIELVEMLLRCGANPKMHNKRHESAHALAERSNCEPIIRMFGLPMKEIQQQPSADTVCPNTEHITST